MAMSREDNLSAELKWHLTRWKQQGRLNGVFFKVKNEFQLTAETKIGRIRQFQKRRAVGVVTGALDWVIHWGPQCGFIELKAPQGYMTSKATGKIIKNPKQRAGTLSDEQIAFMAECDRCGIPNAVCESIREVEEKLKRWGALK